MGWKVMGVGHGFDGMDDRDDEELRRAYEKGMKKGYERAQREMEGGRYDDDDDDDDEYGERYSGGGMYGGSGGGSYGCVWHGGREPHTVSSYFRLDASAHCSRNHQQRSFRVGVGSAFPFLCKKRLSVEVLVELVGEFHAHVVQYVSFKLFPVYHFGCYFYN